MKKAVVVFILMMVLMLGAAMADTLVLPEDTTVIETEAFYGVDAETIILPECVTTIGDKAFGGSETLQIVFVPQGLMDREQAALQGSPNARFYQRADQSMFEYETMNNGSVRINKYTGNLTNVVIPSVIDGKPVTALGKQVFDGNETVTKVVIPEGITSISDYVFRNCSNLTDITFPSTLTSYVTNAFTGCGSNATEPFYFVLPDSISTYMGDNSETHGFPGCNAILVCNPATRTAYNIGGYITFPGQYDFRFHYEGNGHTLHLLTYVGAGPVAEIADNIGLEIIKDSAFLDCSQLTKVVIPEGVTSIRQYAFKGCSNLTDITFPQSLTQIDAEAFIGCGANSEDPFYFRLPDNVTSSNYGDEATHGYKDCNAVLVVTPKSETAYHLFNKAWFTFENQYDYRYRYVGNDNVLYLIKYVGTGTVADIPGNVELINIYKNAFQDCSRLAKVIIPEGVTVIEQYAFQGCSNLTDISFPDSLTSISPDAFIGCGASSAEPFYFRLPDNVTSSNYGDENTHGYEDCNAILVVTPKSVTAYHLYSNAWFTFEDQYDYRYRYVGNDNRLYLVKYVGSDEEISIPADVELKMIYSSAFRNCAQLTKVTIPEGVTSIELSAFENCLNLTDVTFPSSLTFIGNRAFRFCGENSEAPYYFVLPSNIRSITGYGDAEDSETNASFYGCRAIKVASGATTGSALKAAHYNYYPTLADAQNGTNIIHWND